MLEYIFAKPPEGMFIEISPLPKRGWVPASTYKSVEADVVETAAAEGWTDVYFGVALRRSKGSEKEDIYGTHVLWADIDLLTPPRTVLPPSFQVMSGNGWHFYWLLDTWLTDIDQIEAANKILQSWTKADHCFNVNRLLRVPGTRNSKNGRVAVLQEARPHITYTIEDIFRADNLEPQTKHKISTGDRRGYKSRSERDWAILTDLVRTGFSDTAITALFAEQPCGDKFREDGAAYLMHSCEAVRAKLASDSAEQHEQAATVDRRRAGKQQLKSIYIRDNAYWRMTAKGEMVLSTFVLDPQILYEGDVEDAVLCTVRTADFTWENILFPRSAFNSRKDLDKYLTLSAWVWLGRDDDVRALLPVIMQQLADRGLPKVKTVSVLGRHGDYWVADEHTIGNGQVMDRASASLVYSNPHMTEIPQMNLVAIDLTSTPPDFTDMHTALVNMNEPCVIFPALGWFMATPYKTLLFDLGVRFPILNVYGTRGSGKTSLLRVLQHMVGYKKAVSWDCTTTRFVVLKLLGSTNAVPISFSEYRYSIGGQFTRFVLLSYDLGKDARGRADQSMTEYPLRAPFTVDGEDIIEDSAAKERIVAVILHPEVIAEGTRCFKAFRMVADYDFSLFVTHYLAYTLKQNVKDLFACAQKLVLEAFPMTLPDRVRNNIIVATLGICSYTGFMGLPTPSAEDVRAWFTVPLNNVWSINLGRSKALVDEFVEAVANSVCQHRNDFIHHVETAEGDTTVWFHLSTAYLWWVQMRRRAGQVTLEKDAIRNQLTERYMSREGPGQYIIEPRMKGGAFCYGISLKTANDSGLDVFTTFNSSQMTINF